MNQRCLTIAVTALALAFGVAHVSAAGDEWTSKAVKGLLPGGKESQEKATLRGKIVPRDEKDKDGNPITSAFLEQDDGSLIPLPVLSEEGQRDRRQGRGQGRGRRLLLEARGREGGDRGNGPVDHEGREADPAPDQDHRNQALLARGCGRECPASASRVTWNTWLACVTLEACTGAVRGLSRSATTGCPEVARSGSLIRATLRVVEVESPAMARPAWSRQFRRRDDTVAVRHPSSDRRRANSARPVCTTAWGYSMPESS